MRSWGMMIVLMATAMAGRGNEETSPMNYYGDPDIRHAFEAARAGTAIVSIVVVPDSNGLFGTDGQRGLQGGLCNAINEIDGLAHMGSGVVSWGHNGGDACNAGNAPPAGGEGWSHSGHSTDGFIDVSGAPAGARNTLDGSHYEFSVAGNDLHGLMPAPIWIPDGQSMVTTAALRLSKPTMDGAVVVTGQYYRTASGAPGESTIGLTIRNNVSPRQPLFSDDLDAYGIPGNMMSRYTFVMPAASRPGVSSIEIMGRGDIMGNRNTVGPLYLGPFQAFYPDYGNINVTPLTWMGGQSLKDMWEVLLSTQAKRDGIEHLLEEVAYPAQYKGMDHYTIFVLCSLANDISESGLSADGVNRNDSPDGYTANALRMRDALFPLVSPNSTPLMINALNPPTSLTNEVDEAQPIREGFARYLMDHPRLGMGTVNFDEITTTDEMRSNGYHDTNGTTAHFSADGYDWWARELLSGVLDGPIHATTSNPTRSRSMIRSRRSLLRDR